MKGVVSKETVVLRRLGSSIQKLFYSLICSDEGLTLETPAFRISVCGQFTLSTPLIKPNFCIKHILVWSPCFVYVRPHIFQVYGKSACLTVL